MKTKKGKSVGLYIYDNLYSLIKKSGLLETTSLNTLLNYSLSLGFPLVLEKANKKNSTLLRYAKLQEREIERNFILQIRKEEKSKYYFFQRFMKDFRQLLNKSYPNQELKKKRLLSILTSYILESQTYTNNEEITQQLKIYFNSLKKTNMELEQIADLFDLTITKISDKDNISHYKKNVEKEYK